MLITVTRFVSDRDTTLSLIDSWGTKAEFICFGLEDQKQLKKVPGETRIPMGDYRVKARCHGGMHERYAKKFKFHQGMLEIADVPGFTDVLIHIGNTGDDTAGCLLVGRGAYTQKGAMSLQNSTSAYIEFYQKVIPYALTDDLVIQFIDNDR